MADPHPRIRVFVHLAYGFGAARWNNDYLAGKIPGINEPYAYGYHHAQDLGCQVTYSTDHHETLIIRYFRLCVRLFLKFDFIHAWRNRKPMLQADVIWTHTESQHAAILLLFCLLRPARKPKIIAQSIWLFDEWNNLSIPNRWLFSRLLSRADMLTVHSIENLKAARKLFPKVPSERVLFGIRADIKHEPHLRPVRRPIRVISLGNDVHRDWATLIAALGNCDDVELRIASYHVPPHLYRNCKNVSVHKITSFDDTISFYMWADLMVVSLKPNLHVSGITVLQEAALLGIPSICTDASGLREYFSESEVTYIPCRDPDAIRQAVFSMAESNVDRLNLARQAQARMGPGGLSSRTYVEKHVELSKILLGTAKEEKITTAAITPTSTPAYPPHLP